MEYNSFETQIEILTTHNDQSLDPLQIIKKSQSRTSSCVVLMQKDQDLQAFKLTRHSMQKQYTLQKQAKSKFVVQALNYQKISQSYCLSTKFQQNGSLQNFLSKSDSLSQFQINSIFQKIVEITEYLHSLQIAHLDLKPENFVFSKQWKLKVLDFEHARKSDQFYTTKSRYTGTLKLNSPQRFQTSQFDGFAADVYSIGVILFYMLTKIYPFNQATENCNFFTRFCLYRQKFFPFFLALIEKLHGTNQEIWQEDLIDLLNQMLQPDPLKRISIQQIKYHSWYHKFN